MHAEGGGGALEKETDVRERGTEGWRERSKHEKKQQLRVHKTEWGKKRKRGSERGLR